MGKSNQDILCELKDDINSWYSYWGDNIKTFKDEKSFTALGKQWEYEDVREYEARRKPMLTVNLLYAYIQNVVGETRANTSSIEVRPLEGDDDPKKLSLIEGIIRNIGYTSDTDIIYQTAFENALYGYGAMGCTLDYEDSNSLKQKIIPIVINDPILCFWDPAAKENTKYDGDFCGKCYTLSREEFENKYPNVDYPESLAPIDNYVPNAFEWCKKEEVVLAEIFKKKWKKKKIVLLSNGFEGSMDDANAIIEQHYAMYAFNDIGDPVENFEPITIVDERMSSYYEIWHYKICGTEILEKTKWPSDILPIIYVDGNSAYDSNEGGRQVIRSFTGFADDLQKFYNFLKSEICQYVKSGRKEQWIGTPAMIKGYEEQWKNPDVVQGMLFANPVNGMMPQKVTPIEIPSSLISLSNIVENEIHNVLGIYQANFGANGNEISGIAIKNRVMQGNTAAAIYRSNRDRAIAQMGRLILSLLPAIFDTERYLPVTNEDGQTEIKKINQGGYSDLSGKYDISVSAGSSFQLQKMENLTALKDLIKVYPQSAPLVADKYAKNLDLDDSIVIRDRLKNLVPKEIIAQEEGKPMPQQQQQPNPLEIAKIQNIQADTANKRSQAMKNMSDTQVDKMNMIQEILSTRDETDLARIKAAIENKKSDAEIEKAYLDLLGKM